MRGSGMRNGLVSLLAILMILTTAVSVYGDEDLYQHKFREGMIELTLPEDWTVEECDPAESDGGDYQEILQAEGGAAPGLQLQMYYLPEETEEYLYFQSDAEAARQYYETYGESALLGFYQQQADVEDVVLGEADFFEGQWDGFLRVDVERKKTDGPEESSDRQLVYLTASMADNTKLVHKLLVFSAGNGAALTAQMTEQAEIIANEFYDYGYDRVLTGVSEEWQQDNRVLLLVLLPLVALAGGLFLLAKKRKGGKTARPFPPLSTLLSRPAEAKPAKNSKAGRDASEFLWKRPQVSRSVERRKPESATRVRTSAKAPSSTDEDRYLESLKTLHASGLLTKEEMREMLEKHGRL